MAFVVFNHARKMVDSGVIDPINGVSEERMIEIQYFSYREELLLQFCEIFLFLEGLHLL